MVSLELRHLEAFTAVAAERSFTRAAKRLHVSQPPLTRLVQQFENELGVTLFRRHGRGAELTAEGELLLDKAKLLVAQARDFLETISRGDSARAGTVRLGIGWGLHELALGARARHAERFPAVLLDVEGIASDRQADALRRRKIDVGIMRRVPVSGNLHIEHLLDERFVVLLSENSPLAGRSSLTLKELAAEPLAQGPDVPDAVYERLLAAHAKYAVKPIEILRYSSRADELSMRLQIASGRCVCVGLCTSSTPITPASGIAVVPLDEPTVTSSVCLAWRVDETSQVVLQFLDSVRQMHLDLASKL